LFTIGKLKPSVGSDESGNNLKVVRIDRPQSTPVPRGEKGENLTDNNILEWKQGEALAFSVFHLRVTLFHLTYNLELLHNFNDH